MIEESEDPYDHEPSRSDSLIIHGDQPMNAEVPVEILLNTYLTPNKLFYIRHHHPVPLLLQKEIENYILEIYLSHYVTNNDLCAVNDSISDNKPFK